MMSSTATRERDLARQLGVCYAAERAAYEALTGGAPGKGARHPITADPGVWVRLVRFCASRSIDPLAYLAWRFEEGLPGRPPTPQELLNARAADAYRAALQEDGREIEVAYRVQQQAARTAILLAQRLGGRTGPDAWAAVLLDEGLPLSALYRYALALSIGGARFERIAALYAAAAASQYRRHRAHYDAVWGPWIPRPLRELVV
jgi:hypothetical protein